MTQAAAYAAFADDGRYCRPRAIESVTDSTGKRYDVGGPDCQQALDPEVVAQLNETLTQIGRRNALLLSSGLIAAFALGSIIAPLVFGDSAIGQTMYVTIGFMLMGLAYGQTAGAVTSRLGARYRYTGAALTSDLAWLFGAGFAPLVALGLSARYGLWMVGLYLLSGAAASLLALTLDRSEMRQM